MYFQRRTFSIRSLLTAMLSVAMILLWLTPRIDDQRAENRLRGSWEVRLEEVLTPMTETRIVEFRTAEQYGLYNKFDSSQFWRVRGGVLLSRVCNAVNAKERYDVYLKIEWKNDDEFAATIEGTPHKVYYRRLPSEPR